jgi:predicted phage terminase large subunit-like protein
MTPAVYEELADLIAEALEPDGSSVPPTFGDWMAMARGEHDWTAAHFVAMQSVLDSVTRGERRRCYFQIPIRHGKTEHNTIGYAVYRLERDPRTRLIVGSYNQTQAQKFSREIRRLAKARGIALSAERDAAGEWETAAGGGVRAVGAGAGVAGVNADVILIDDPIGSRDEAESPAHRDRVFDWITSDLLARAEPHTAVIMTMSRWHQDDPAGRLLERQRAQWHVLDLPAEAEPNDPLGREVGAPLWPELRGTAWLAEKRIELLDYGFASLLQGRPRPREGGMFKWEWWKSLATLPATGRIVRYWDMAGTRPSGGGSDPDYTAGVAMCQFPEGTAIVHCDRFRVEVAARDARIVDRAQADLVQFGRHRLVYWIEAQAGISGAEATQSLVRRLQALGVAVYTERATGSKAERATPLASAALAGNVYLAPDDPTAPWHDAFKLEAADFPHGKHDDQVDAAAGAFAKLSTPPPSVSFGTRNL